MLNFKKQIANSILDAIHDLWPAAELTAVEIEDMLEYPPDEAMGNLAFPCFKLSRVLRAAPPAIASAIAEKIGASDIAKISVAGGYLNIHLSDAYLADSVLSAIEDKKETYGASDMGVGKNVVLDYSSPNVSKPFHIGHLGTTVSGDSFVGRNYNYKVALLNNSCFQSFCHCLLCNLITLCELLAQHCGNTPVEA